MQINPYLFFNGDCEAALKLYADCLGGKIDAMFTHEGSPMEGQVPAEWKKKIMHGRVSVGDWVLMASDAPPGRYSKPQGYSVSIGVDDPKQAERIFAKLSEGGMVTMPLAETFWAQKFGMFTDRFGIPWMVNCEKRG